MILCMVGAHMCVRVFRVPCEGAHMRMHACIHALQGANMHDSSITFTYVYIHMT